MNVSSMIRGFSLVAAAGSLIAVSTLSGCASGTVSGTANVNTGLINGTVQFQGTWGTPQGATSQVGHTTYKGKVYPVYKDANGEIFIYVEGVGYLKIDAFVEIISKQTQGTQGTNRPSGAAAAVPDGSSDGGSHYEARMALKDVDFSWDTNVRQAQLNFPAFPGMILPSNPQNYGVTVQTYDAGGETWVSVTGFDNGVSLYGLNCGLDRLELPADLVHPDLNVSTESTWVTVQDFSGRAIGRMRITATTIDDPQTAGFDEVRFLTRN